MAEKILEVNNLTISFKTDNGLVRAVRGVSFDLEPGETLCIVGESGSGKSVTSKAIMGILAANAIIDDGSIMYQGENLLEVHEDEFHKIRGKKIGMIFQDPLSSLNPIVRVGKQITEAMLINSNKIKILYEDLISKEFIAYKNCISRCDIRTNNAKTRSEKAINKLLDDHAAKIKALKEESKKAEQSIIAKYDEEINKVTVSLEAEHVTTNAKIARCNQEISNIKLNASEKIAELKDNDADAQAIDSVKHERNEKIALVSEDIKAIKAGFVAIKAQSAQKIKELKAQCKAEIQPLAGELKAKLEALEPEKDVIKAEIANIREQVKEKIAAYKAEKDANLPELKAKLDVRKAEAKIEVAQYKEKVNNEYKEKLTTLNATLADLAAQRKADPSNADIVEEYNKVEAQIKQTKTDYKGCFKITKAAAKAKALEIMREVGIPLPERRFRQYPFEFSGGMRQRIVIAIALTASPEVLICDEPTTALDVTIQAQILELIKKIQKERNIACIFITHDLGVVANMADRVAVMYAGKIVEYGTSEEIFFDPRHPYTWALLSSIPDVDSKERLEAIPGTPPNMIFPPVGDAFALRSKYAMSIDFKQEPPYFKVSDTHYAKTWLLHENAPKVEMPKIVSERIRIALANKEVSSDEK